MKVRKQLRKRKVRFLSIRQKFMLIAAACILLVSFTIGGISYFTMQEKMLEMAADKAQAIGVLAAKQVDKKVVSGFQPGDEDKVQYTRIRELLYDLKESSNVKYMYTLYTDGTTVYYGVDGDLSDDFCRIGEEFPEDYEFLKPVFENGEILAVPELDESEGECLVTSYVPLIDIYGNVVGALGVDYDATGFKVELTSLQLQVISVILVGCIISIALLYFATGRIVKSIKQVNDKLDELIHSDGDLTQTLTVKTGDEMEVMGGLINGLLSYIRDIMVNVSDNSEILTDASEALVPIATIVRPIIIDGIPNILATDMHPSTNISAPFIRSIKPIISIKYSIFYSFRAIPDNIFKYSPDISYPIFYILINKPADSAQLFYQAL